MAQSTPQAPSNPVSSECDVCLKSTSTPQPGLPGWCMACLEVSQSRLFCQHSRAAKQLQQACNHGHAFGRIYTHGNSGLRASAYVLHPTKLAMHAMQSPCQKHQWRHSCTVQGLTHTPVKATVRPVHDVQAYEVYACDCARQATFRIGAWKVFGHHSSV